MSLSLKFLLLVWLIIFCILVYGLLTGKMFAHGSKGGGRGLGHFADYKHESSAFWMHAILYSALCVYLFLGTDGFTFLEGISRFVGRETPIQ